LDDTLGRARQLLVEALGQQSAFWGVGKVTGQLYATLYLSEGPLSLGDLAARLGASKGHVSMAIRTLEQLGMVRRTLRPADRRVYFEAETDLWGIARHVLERRQRPEFDRSFAMVDEAVRMAEAAPEGEGRAWLRQRLRDLSGFYTELDALVALAVRWDPRRLSRLARLLGRRFGAAERAR
jgi:DNA-binding transcriptional regulator GbsR (MarR family)